MYRNLQRIRGEPWSLRILQREPLKFEIVAAAMFGAVDPAARGDPDRVAREAIEAALLALADKPRALTLERQLKRARAHGVEESQQLEVALTGCRDVLARYVRRAIEHGGYKQVWRVAEAAEPSLATPLSLSQGEDLGDALRLGWPEDAPWPSEKELAKAVKYVFASGWRPMPKQGSDLVLYASYGDDYRVKDHLEGKLVGSEAERARTLVFRLLGRVLEHFNARARVNGLSMPLDTNKLSLSIWAMDAMAALRDPMVTAAKSGGYRALVQLVDPHSWV